MDEAPASPESVAVSEPSVLVSLGSAVPVVVILVTNVEPSEVNDDAVTPVVSEADADSALEIAEPAEDRAEDSADVPDAKTVLVPIAEVMTLPSLLVMVDSIVVVAIAPPTPVAPVPVAVPVSVPVELPADSPVELPDA